MRSFFFFFSIYSCAEVDLSSRASLCINYVKKIELPNVFQPHNASIVSYERGYLISFRIRDPQTRASHTVGLVKLDRNFNPVGEVKILNLPFSKKGHITVQDPRLFWLGDQLVVVFSHFITKKMYVATLQQHNTKFYASSVNSIEDFAGKKTGRMEKNWMPFAYKDGLYFVYSIVPHTIFKYERENNYCRLINSTKTPNKWTYGEMRGSTPCLSIDNYYLTFFHSSKSMKSTVSNGRKMPHYYIGAYVFENKPFFKVKAMTPVPIIHPSFYDGDTSLTHKPLKVVFPCGFCITGRTIYLTYGKQDSEIWIASIDLNKLLDSLISI